MTSIDFHQPPEVFARNLVGGVLTLEGVGGRIVETEAYDASDPASHSFRGPTLRNAAMFGPVGLTYVYRSHGLHWCLNIVCGPQAGGAVLIRAIQPLTGIEMMRERRGMEAVERLCSGPGKLCQALGVTKAHDGLPLLLPPFSLTSPKAEPLILVGPRIGISKGVETPWRFGLAGSAFLSRKF
jgi:DNA-3-methyladenine glycosylase